MTDLQPLPEQMDWQEVQKKLIEIVDQVHATGQQLAVTRNGKVIARIVPHVSAEDEP